ncbi:ArsR/SmtB family transcription factor [Nonomuraea sp. NPDC050783]|uniref:ArsR/SmtB family transcription factor n=1 Tax=Nonomuraea sp. NPDC050783 TaxID=3154634 RepID=UPI0034668048
MPRTHSRRPALVHPDTGDIDLQDVLRALADPTRLTIVRTLRTDPERACGTFPVDVAPSTLTHHFRVLREAGVIRQREDGTRRWTALRLEDLDIRFPGLLDAILTAYAYANAADGTTHEQADD